MIVRTQESAQEPSGSWRLCSLPRTHPGHRQEYVRTHGPWIAASGSSSCRQAAGEIPRFSVVRSDGPAIHRAECCLAIFPLPWLVTAGTGAGAEPRPPHSPWGRLSRHLLLGRLFPATAHRRRTPLPGFVRCRLFRVSDTRSKPLNQEDSINGYPQQLKTRSGTQDRNRQGDRLGKRGRRDHPSQRHLFADLPQGGPVEDHAELPFRQPAFPLPSSPTRHTHSLPSARPRRPRRLGTTKPAKRRTFRRRVKSRRLFPLDARAGERTGRAFRNDHCVGSFSRLCHGVGRERAV